jgi:hypothetical protein
MLLNHHSHFGFASTKFMERYFACVDYFDMVNDVKLVKC